jgi:hypothetical protein
MASLHPAGESLAGRKGTEMLEPKPKDDDPTGGDGLKPDDKPGEKPEGKPGEKDDWAEKK